MTLPNILATDFAINSKAVVSTTSAEPQNLYKIVVTEAGTLKLQTTRSTAINGGGSFDTKLELYDAAGTLVATNDDNGASAFSLISSAVTAGDYFVKAGHFIENGFAGVFDFSASLVTTANPTPTIADLGKIVKPAPATFTQAQVDAAVAAAVAAATTTPVIVPTVTTNPLTLDKTDASGIVTLYKASTGYLAIATDTEIKGNGNANVLTANDSGMKIVGAGGADTIAGGAGADTIQGDAGMDSISGGVGADTLMGGADADVLNGGAGSDSMLGGASADTLNGGDDADTLNVEAGNDVAHGDAGNDTVSGEAGDDVLHGDFGDDLLLGGAGLDTLNGGDGADSLVGEAGADSISGDAGIDTLVGGVGNDILNGGADNDTVIGGVGIDTMTGGLGIDTFVFDVKDSNIGKSDTITDFEFGDIIKVVASNAITVLGNYEPAIKAVAGYEATATTAAILPVTGKAAVNLPTANTAAFEVATGKLYINTDVDDVFEYSITLTGVTDASEITIQNVAAL